MVTCLHSHIVHQLTVSPSSDASDRIFIPATNCFFEQCVWVPRQRQYPVCPVSPLHRDVWAPQAFYPLLKKCWIGAQMVFLFMNINRVCRQCDRNDKADCKGRKFSRESKLSNLWLMRWEYFHQLQISLKVLALAGFYLNINCI